MDTKNAKKAATKKTTKKAATRSTSSKLSTRSTSSKLSAKSTATKSSTKSSIKSSIPPDYLNTKLVIDNNLKSKRLIKIDKNTYFINKPKYGGVPGGVPDDLRDNVVLTSSQLVPGALPRDIRDVGRPPRHLIRFLINQISNIFNVRGRQDRQVYLEIASPTRLPNPQDIVLTRLYNSVRNHYPNLYILVVIERSGPNNKKSVIIKLCGGIPGDANVISRDFGHLSLIIGEDGREANPHFTFNRTSPLVGHLLLPSEVMRLYFNYDDNIAFTLPLFGEHIASHAYHLSMLHSEQDLHRTQGIPVDFYLRSTEVTFVSDLMWLIARLFRNQINNAIDPMRRFTLVNVSNAGTDPANLIQGNNLIRGNHPGLVHRGSVVRRPVMGPTGIPMLNKFYYGGKK
jgi:hypothetical protein